MKVIESHSAVLSNLEVYQHLADQQPGLKQKRRRGPANYETVVKELKSWLEVAPMPLSQKSAAYTTASIQPLLERLRPFDLSKGELIMILNLRPDSVAALNTVIEDMPERLTDEQQEELVNIIGEVLGQFEPPAADAQANGEAGDADVTMGDEVETAAS